MAACVGNRPQWKRTGSPAISQWPLGVSLPALGFRRAAVRAFDARRRELGDRLPARRAEPEPREVRQAQRPGAQAGAVAAPFAAGLRNVSERVGAGIVAIGVRRRTDADRVRAPG